MASGNETSPRKSNLSKSSIIEAANLYITLFSCPFYEKLYWKAMYGANSRIVLLASNIIKRAEGDLKLKALQIFSGMSAVLGFKHISYNHAGNESLGENVELTKNIIEVKGKIL